ncbi:MAG: nucleotide exchange factor GrpE [Pseudomonadota bacterium]|nr:nucleotide exchange factor GrpE [Pseudomonadota bacterium]
MTEDEELHDDAEALREETAAGAPELAEHDRLAELEAELEEANNKALYAAAELQNARRRMDKEMADSRTYAAAGFARDMLAVRDHLQRAIDHVPEGARDGDMANFVSGIEATLRELDSVFQRNGVERVPAKGLALDPNRHQAMVEIPSNEEPGTVIEELQSGYVMKDRLLRPALVGVAKKPG